MHDFLANESEAAPAAFPASHRPPKQARAQRRASFAGTQRRRTRQTNSITSAATAGRTIRHRGRALTGAEEEARLAVGNAAIDEAPTEIVFHAESSQLPKRETLQNDLLAVFEPGDDLRLPAVAEAVINEFLQRLPRASFILFLNGAARRRRPCRSRRPVRRLYAFTDKFSKWGNQRNSLEDAERE